jgi:hypothetical protein
MATDNNGIGHSLGSLAVLYALERPCNQERTPVNSKYSQIVWLSGAPAEVSTWVLGQEPEHFRIVTVNLLSRRERPAVIQTRGRRTDARIAFATDTGRVP